MPARSFLGAGRVLADIFIAGAPSGSYVPFEEVGKFSIKPNSELKEQTSKARATYGQPIEAVAIQRPADFSMTLREINKDALRFAFSATSVPLTQAAATVAAEVVIAKLGSFVQLTKKNLAIVGIVVTNSAAAITYVAGTDYEINHAHGLFRAVVGGAIVDLQSVRVSYTAGVIAGTKLQGGTVPSVRARLLFDGVNLVDDSPTLATVWEVLLTPDSEVDLMSDDWVEVTLTGRMKTPIGKASPFEIDLPQQA